MLFAIHCLDKDGVLEKRMSVMQAHRDYLATAPVTVVMSGPLMSDDEQTIIGSFYLIEAENRAAIEAFQKDDPLVAADLWKSAHATVFNKRVG